MSADAYSPLKITRHLDILGGVRAGAPTRPAHVQIILSDLCNQACHFCAYRDPEYTSAQLFYEIDTNSARGLRRDAAHPERNYNPNRMIPYDKVLEILGDCDTMGVSGIQFTGGGEPTVHPSFLDVVRNTAAYKLPYALVTNGVLIGARGWAEHLGDAAWVRVSLDAGRPGTYAAIRNVPERHFADAVFAIRELAKTRTLVGVGFVVTPENWREVLQATWIARDAGADNIRISAQFSAQNEALFNDFHGECADLCANAETLSTDTFHVYNRFSQKMDDLRQQRPEYSWCGYQQATTYIGADLNVYRCCVLSYNERGLVGSLKGRSFADLWLSQDRMNAMMAFDARGCDRCQFNGINRVLDYAMGPGQRQHSEFV